jgi:hypothetical protein
MFGRNTIRNSEGGILKHSSKLLLLVELSYIFIDKYDVLCIFFANWHSPATLTEVFRAFSSVVRQMLGYT